ncbi:ROK family protein [Kitasatospora sp. NBC_01539]|uniref:ROK family protein n=1 Tax=Kitasatospora sp. NBC_01539 TaxID=2903577 RepID=UPI00386017B2
MSKQRTELHRPGPAAARPLYAALDIGGTKIAGGLVDAEGALLAQVQRPTPAREAADVVARALDEVLTELAEHPSWPEAVALGVGSAGPVDVRAGRVSPVNIPAWRGFPVLDHVAAHPAARGLPAVLGGDAVAMTAGEHWRGAARGHRNALCIVVSTGVGGGLVLDGAVHAGPTGNAGHLGHITVDLDGDPCPCGSRGCLELLASGTAIARHAHDHGWRPTGPDASAAAVAASAAAGDPVAIGAFDRAAQALAAGIAATATLVELDTVVVGGGVAGAGELFFAPLRRHLATYAALPFTAGLTVTPALLGTDAGLVGAAALAIAAARPDARAEARPDAGTGARTAGPSAAGALSR